MELARVALLVARRLVVQEIQVQTHQEYKLDDRLESWPDKDLTTV